MGKGAGKGGDGSVAAPTELAREDEWVKQFDGEAFRKDIQDLGNKLAEGQGEADIKHLQKIILWSNAFAALGIATLWWSPNIFTVACLSLWTFSRWTMIAHHVCHGGYDKVEGNSYFNRFSFAIGGVYKRLTDWLDWMLPEAWNVEHNNLHHYKLGEDTDPDLVERNLVDIRDSDMHIAFKYMVVAFFMLTWKWFYYAPNTYKEMKLAQLRTKGIKISGKAASELITVRAMIFQDAEGWADMQLSSQEFFVRVLGPYFFVHFLMLPLPLLFISKPLFWNAVINLLLADVLTNVHSFVVIVTNHAGDDLYRFDTPCKPKSAAFYLRQVISSANFDTGNDVNDFLHGWLNYQVEHHLWPQLSMLSYQRSQPIVKEICAKHGVPYIQHNVFWRLKKTTDIMVGTATMRKYPAAAEGANVAEVTAAPALAK